jgi:hypothetical protein
MAAANKAYKLKITDKIEVAETNKNISRIVMPKADVE